MVLQKKCDSCILFLYCNYFNDIPSMVFISVEKILKRVQLTRSSIHEETESAFTGKRLERDVS